MPRVIIRFVFIFLSSFFLPSCIDVDAYDTKRLLRKANFQFDAQEYEQAANILTGLVVEDSAEARWFGNLGNALYSGSSFEKAKDNYKKQLFLAKKDDQKVIAHYHLGNTFTLQSNFLEALDEYDECLKIVPDSACKNNRAMVLDILKVRNPKGFRNYQDNKKKEAKALESLKLSEETKARKKEIDSLSREGTYADAYRKIDELMRKDSLAEKEYKTYRKRLEQVYRIDTTFVTDDESIEK